jgi:hypothetical protein
MQTAHTWEKENKANTRIIEQTFQVLSLSLHRGTEYMFLLSK